MAKTTWRNAATGRGIGHAFASQLNCAALLKSASNLRLRPGEGELVRTNAMEAEYLDTGECFAAVFGFHSW